MSSHLDRTNLVNKGFIIWLSGKLFLRDMAGSPESARVANHIAQFGFTLPARGASHLIKHVTVNQLKAANTGTEQD